MNAPDDSCLKCSCGRTFLQENAFGNHRRICKQSKKRTSDIVGRAKDLLLSRKRQRLDDTSKTREAAVSATPDLYIATQAIENLLPGLPAPTDNIMDIEVRLSKFTPYLLRN
jgi:hypothetical protein